MRILILFFTFVALTAACTRTPVSVDLANACAVDNEKKYVVTSGFLSAGGSIFCSNIGSSRINCGLDVVAEASGKRVMGADVEQGSGPNRIAKLESGYKKEDVKILDNTGQPVQFTDKVKLTGQMSIAPDASVCFMTVDKIER